MQINILLLFFYESWPAYMVTFFHTACYSNPTVTFTLITNMNFSHPSWSTAMYGMPVPPNVVLVPSSYEEVRKRIVTDDRLGLGFKPNVKTPYKLTDYAPGWGKLFEEQLVGYTHW
jgi:hypothetical protein